MPGVGGVVDHPKQLRRAHQLEPQRRAIAVGTAPSVPVRPSGRDARRRVFDLNGRRRCRKLARAHGVTHAIEPDDIRVEVTEKGFWD